MDIKNIIFDLGGVIYDIRYENIADELKKLGITNFEQMYSQASQKHFIDKFEIGAITPEEFRNEIRMLANVELSDDEIDRAWNAILLDVPESRVKFLGVLKQKYKLFLFSNTNKINCDKFKVELEKKFGFDIFTEIFNESFMSHEIGHRKPNAGGFLHILEKHKLNPVETLFIDDTQRHVDAARTIGLYAYCLRKGEEITDLFNEKLNIRPEVLMQ